MWLIYCEGCSCESLFLVNEIKTVTGTGTFMFGLVWFLCNLFLFKIVRSVNIYYG
jgi:hypothetical protein